MRFQDGLNLFRLLGGKKYDDRNNILKSVFLLEESQGTVVVECEPYDNAYNTEKIDDTVAKICRVIDKREKAIFKRLSQICDHEINNLSFTFYDDMSVYSGGTKFLGKKMTTNF